MVSWRGGRVRRAGFRSLIYAGRGRRGAFPERGRGGCWLLVRLDAGRRVFVSFPWIGGSLRSGRSTIVVRPRARGVENRGGLRWVVS